MKAYRNLANAIIIQAVKDYKNRIGMLNYLLKTPEFNGKRIVEIKMEIDKIESFFRSELYDEMTDISGEDVIKKVRKEVEQ